MTPELVRSIWKLIEIVPTDNLVNLESESLVCLLTERLLANGSITPEQVMLAKTYLRSKITLIHELFECPPFSQQVS